MRLSLFIVCLCSLLGTFSVRAPAQKNSVKPQLFAPGVITTADDELNAAFAHRVFREIERFPVRRKRGIELVVGRRNYPAREHLRLVRTGLRITGG